MAPINKPALADAWLAAIQKLSPSSPEADFAEYASFLSADCKLYMQGMSAPPVEGKEAAIATMKQLTTFWRIAEARVKSEAESADGNLLVREMDNDLIIAGERLDHFPETEFVEFDSEGKIVSFRIYTDPKPVGDILAKKAAEAAEKGPE
jgi:hypothetical protein